MRKYILLLCLILVLGLFVEAKGQVADAKAKGQHELLGMAGWTDSGEGVSNPHPNAQWFPDAGFGLFIHWGMAAVHGGIDLSWGMLANKPWGDDGTITPNEYYALLEEWHPAKMDMDKIMKAAKSAGIKYAVFVTKHHDGFTLWPTNYGEIGTKKSFNGRDFVKEYVDACRKYGLKVGFYYSPPDWYFDRLVRSWNVDDSQWLDMNHQKIQPRVKPAGHDEAHAQMVRNQVRELLTKYGTIDQIWFDGGKGEISNDEVRKLQPGIVINDRNGDHGDYNSDFEGRIPQKRVNGWFEVCDPCWSNHWWSYSTNDTYENASSVITNLAKMRAWGGNYLANVGPMGSGEIPENVYGIWKDMAAWMKHSSEAIFNVKAGNYPENSSVPVTVKKNIAYCFALPGYQGYITLNEVRKPKKVSLLRTQETLSYIYDNGVLELQIPANLRTRFPDVVKIEW